MKTYILSADETVDYYNKGIPVKDSFLFVRIFLRQCLYTLGILIAFLAVGISSLYIASTEKYVWEAFTSTQVEPAVTLTSQSPPYCYAGPTNACIVQGLGLQPLEIDKVNKPTYYQTLDP